jgi:hypothetical protein
MPYTEMMPIRVDSRNTLVRHRDMIERKYGVEMFFPRGNVRGEHQDMVLKGGVSSIFSARKEIAHVLHTWSEEYCEFKERKARRHRDQRLNCVDDVMTIWPSLEQRSTTVKKVVSTNAFAALGVDEPCELSASKAEKVVPEKKVSTVPVLTGWAAMAAKPAVPANAVPTAVVAATDEDDEVTNDMSKMNWGDFADNCGDW